MIKTLTPDNRRNICGNNIARIRKERGFSQRQLAEKLQIYGLVIDKNAIQRIESGKRVLTDIESLALCKTFNITFEELASPFSIIVHD